MGFKSLAILSITALCFTSLAAQTVQRGKASYYSKKSTGARTSSGERIHHDSLTCAHRTHPFGTRLKVTNPSTGKSVIVKVTDRGPFKRGRIIDLSWGAAKELGMLSQGVATVIVERADKLIVPFKPEEDTFFELDFERTDNKNKDGLHPKWQEMKEAVSPEQQKTDKKSQQEVHKADGKKQSEKHKTDRKKQQEQPKTSPHKASAVKH